MVASNERIDGWKSIAGYLGRDRSTVIRWTNERGLPVHSLPGGTRRTVYAIRGELDAWLQQGGLKADAQPETGEESRALAPVPAPLAQAIVAESSSAPQPYLAVATAPLTFSRAARRWRAIGITAGLVLAVLAVAWLLMPARKTLPPLDPATEAQYLQAADQVASRSTADLDEALATLRTISQRKPNNAEVQATLAEAYLLAREFGSLPDGYALAAARRTATRALQLDERSAKALRVLGLIAYWRDQDPSAAGTLFRRAISMKPSDALSHQWYGNILADNGEEQAAMREFRIARQLNPGAPYLLADYAWALWSVGRTEEGEALLTDIARVPPAMASVYDGLSVMAFARGDLKGYARHLRERALVRQAPELLAHSRLVDKVSGSSRGLYDAMLGRALAQAEMGPQSDHSWAAFVASVFGDRNELVSILRLSASRGEHWGAAGFTRQITARWRNDAAVRAGLVALRQPAIEPDT